MSLRLQAIEPGFLKKDVYKHAKENNLTTKCLTSSPDMKLLEVGAFQLHVLPRSQNRILDAKKYSLAKSRKTTQLVCNYNPNLAPDVEIIDLRLGNITNPYEAIRSTPVHSSGELSWSHWLQTRVNPGKLIPEMSLRSLQTQEEEKAKRHSTANDARARPGKPLTKCPLSSYQRKDSGEIADDIVSLWGQVENDSPANRKIERDRERARACLF